MNIYKVHNLINGKMYIGMNSNDSKNYMGSGKLLKLAIAKYGIENFKKEILEECSTEEELRAAEIRWIRSENAVESSKYYNLMEGGRGGKTGNHPPMSKKVKATWDNYTPEEREARGKILSDSRIKSGIAKGSKNPTAKRALVNGKEYDCLKDALVDYPTVPYSSLKTIVRSKNKYSPKWDIKAKYI